MKSSLMAAFLLGENSVNLHIFEYCIQLLELYIRDA